MDLNLSPPVFSHLWKTLVFEEIFASPFLGDEDLGMDTNSIFVKVAQKYIFCDFIVNYQNIYFYHMSVYLIY